MRSTRERPKRPKAWPFPGAWPSPAEKGPTSRKPGPSPGARPPSAAPAQRGTKGFLGIVVGRKDDARRNATAERAERAEGRDFPLSEGFSNKKGGRAIDPVGRAKKGDKKHSEWFFHGKLLYWGRLTHQIGAEANPTSRRKVLFILSTDRTCSKLLATTDERRFYRSFPQTPFFRTFSGGLPQDSSSHTAPMRNPINPFDLSRREIL